MDKLKTKKWWKAAGTRAIKTFAQAAIATLGTTAILQDVNVMLVLGAAGMAALFSILTSFAGLPEIKEN